MTKKKFLKLLWQSIRVFQKKKNKKKQTNIISKQKNCQWQQDENEFSNFF